MGHKKHAHPCGICRPHKRRGTGPAARTPYAARRKLGVKRRPTRTSGEHTPTED